MRKLIHTFQFQESFKRDVSPFMEDTVYIRLEIDYSTNRFQITPDHANVDDGFIFSGGSNNHISYWKAILKAMDRAVDFANEELNKYGI